MNSKLFNKLKALADEIIVESTTSLTESKRFKANYVMFNANRGELDLDHLTYFPDGYFTDDTTWDTFDEAEYFILDRYKKNYNSPEAMHVGFLETKTGKYWIVNDDGKLEQVNLDHAPKEPKIKKKDLPKQYKFDKSVPDEDLNKINARIDSNKEKIKNLKSEINKYQAMLDQFSDEPVLLSAVKRKIAELNKELEYANSFSDRIRREYRVTKSMLNDARKRSKANSHKESNSELEEDFQDTTHTYFDLRDKVKSLKVIDEKNASDIFSHDEYINFAYDKAIANLEKFFGFDIFIEPSIQGFSIAHGGSNFIWIDGEQSKYSWNFAEEYIDILKLIAKSQSENEFLEELQHYLGEKVSYASDSMTVSSSVYDVLDLLHEAGDELYPNDNFYIDTDEDTDYDGNDILNLTFVRDGYDDITGYDDWSITEERSIKNLNDAKEFLNNLNWKADLEEDFESEALKNKPSNASYENVLTWFINNEQRFVKKYRHFSDIADDFRLFYDYVDQEFPNTFTKDDKDSMWVDFTDSISELSDLVDTLSESTELNKQEVLDWLSEHELAWEDFVNYFEDVYQPITKVPMDEILGWISEHNDLAEDFENNFGISVNADIYDDFSEEELEEKLQSNLQSSTITNINSVKESLFDSLKKPYILYNKDVPQIVNRFKTKEEADAALEKSDFSRGKLIVITEDEFKSNGYDKKVKAREAEMKQNHKEAQKHWKDINSDKKKPQWCLVDGQYNRVVQCFDSEKALDDFWSAQPESQRIRLHKRYQIVESYNIGSNKNVPEDSREYELLQQLADALTEYSPNSYIYKVKQIYEDFGAGMQWKTIVCYDNSGDDWQVLSTKDWLDLANTGDVQAVFNQVISNKYFQDTVEKGNTASLFKYMNDLD